jgi:hypothetical protein
MKNPCLLESLKKTEHNSDFSRFAQASSAFATLPPRPANLAGQIRCQPVPGHDGVDAQRAFQDVPSLVIAAVQMPGRDEAWRIG